MNLFSGAAFKSCFTYLPLIMFLAGYAGPSLSAGQRLERAETGNFRSVERGVEHLQLARGHKSDDDATGPWVINLLRIDLTVVDLRLAHALDEGVGLETTSSMSARHGAIAAINAGFFRTTGTYRGEPTGALKVDGKLISDPLQGRAALGLIRGPLRSEIIFAHLRFSGYIESNRRRFNISGLNRPRGADELIVYTPAFHRTTLTTPDGVEVIVRQNKVITIREAAGSSVIPADGFVISGLGKARTWLSANLRAGSRVRISTDLETVEGDRSELLKRSTSVVGGGPQLIKDGRVSISYAEEKIESKFVTDRHPRTAIARLADGKVLLATVDGRQPGVSSGMSLPELASLLLEFGATEAINLDGGGSTAMVVEGKLVNHPSDQTGERPVSDALLILPRTFQQKPRMH